MTKDEVMNSTYMDTIHQAFHQAWSDNRTLWDDTFTALKRHQNLLSEWHDRSQIFSFQIDILNSVNKTLSYTYDNKLEPCPGTYHPSVEWTTASMSANRKLWDDLFDALKQHYVLLNDQHEQSHILRIQIDTMNIIKRILSDTLKGYYGALIRAL